MGYLEHKQRTYLWSLTANETISLWDLQKETRIWHSGTSFRDDLSSYGKVPVDYLLGCLTADDSSDGFFVTAGNFQGDGIVFNVTPEQSVALTYLRGSGTSAHYSSLRSLVLNPSNGKIYTGLPSLLSLLFPFSLSDDHSNAVGEDSRLCSWQRGEGEERRVLAGGDGGYMRTHTSQKKKKATTNPY
jgi:hypothetical protein